MTVSIIFSAGYDPEYLRIAEQLVMDTIENNSIPIVYDLAAIMRGPTESHSPAILKLAGIKAPSQLFQSTFSSLGATVETPDWVNPNIDFLSEQAKTVLEESINSALFTYFRTDLLNLKNKRVKKIRQRLFEEGVNSYVSVKNFLQNVNPVVAYIPNGRFPIQRMAKEALSESNILIWHYEKGATKDHAFLRPYSPHDRIASQSDVDKVLDGLTTSTIEKVADKWLEDRLPSRNSTNEFTEIWASSPAKTPNSETQDGKIGFFTSSQDEFLNLGPDWQLHSWESQFEAFDALINFFENKGYQCFLRVHPNLTTKDHSCYKREILGLTQLAGKHPNLKIYWHDDPTSSYLLLSGLSGIVVWDSTIGLEASAQGIPVWNCAASYYGLIADTRQALGFESLTDENLEPWKVDRARAKRFIAALVLKDKALSTSTAKWVYWDATHPPFIVKLAAAVRSGGAPTLTDVLLSIVDPWRHRNIKVNKTLFKSKFKKMTAK